MRWADVELATVRLVLKASEAPGRDCVVAGGWRRAGRSLGQLELDEPSDVVWLQVGEVFADLRVPRAPSATAPADSLSPLDAAQCFSGTVRVRNATVTWSHDLDTFGRPSDHSDRAEVEADGEWLLERGEGYLERWRRVEAAGADSAVAERAGEGGRPEARVVRLGAQAIAIWSAGARGGARFEAGAGWRPVASVGDPCGLAEANSVLDALLAGKEAPGGWTEMCPR